MSDEEIVVSAAKSAKRLMEAGREFKGEILMDEDRDCLIFATSFCELAAEFLEDNKIK